MYQLFTKIFNSQTAVIKPPGFDYLKRTYQAEVEHIIDYYHSRVYAVKNNHLLCRLLTTASVPLHYELDRYLDVAYTRSPYISKHFNFTSEINYGEVNKSVFYGLDNDEIILTAESYFNPYVVIKDWKNITAVTVLNHPFSDLGLLLPDGKKHSTDTGLVVINIDIPLLLVQYRCFLKEQLLKENNPESVLGVTHFVHIYVLPNMLKSHIDLCIINRLMALYYSYPFGEQIGHYPFPIKNYSHSVDKNLKIVLKHIEKTKMLYFSALKNIPVIFHENSQESLLMPDVAETRQIWWALLICRLNMMKFLIDVGGVGSLAMNKNYINHLKISLKRLLNENMIKALLPDDFYFDTIETIKDIMKL